MRCKKRSVFIGWDTETFPENGTILLIANSKREYLIDPSVKDLLDLLFKYNTDKYFNYFFNLKFDAQAIIKHILHKHDKLLLDKYNMLKTLKIGDYEISFKPNKILEIKIEGKEMHRYFHRNKRKWMERPKGTKKALYLDCYQYYMTSLNNAAKYRLGLQKKDFDASTINPHKFFNNKNYREDMISYCKWDAYLAKMLIDKFYQDIAKLSINTQKLISGGYIGECYLMRLLYKQELMKHYKPKTLGKYYNFIGKSFFGGRFETVKRGHIKTGYIHDINSAYPYIFSQCFQLTGDVFESKERKENCYNIAKVKVDNHKEYINPLTHRLNGGVNVYPAYNYKSIHHLTDYSMDLLDKLNINYEIIEAINVEHNNEILFDFIPTFYEERRKIKEENEGLPAEQKNNFEKALKIIINAMYGKTIQNVKKNIEITYEEWKLLEDNKKAIINYGNNAIFVKKKIERKGKLYNNLWGSRITDGCRKMVYESVMKNPKNLIQFATDSVLVKKPLDNIPISKKLGEWDTEIQKGLVVFGNGQILSENYFRCRGFHFKEFVKPIDVLRVITEGNILKRFNPRHILCKLDKEFGVQKVKGITRKEQYENLIRTKQMITQNVVPFHHHKKWGFEKLRTFQNIKKTFSITDQKRNWDIVEIEELWENDYDSYPLLLDETYIM